MNEMEAMNQAPIKDIESASQALSENALPVPLPTPNAERTERADYIDALKCGEGLKEKYHLIDGSTVQSHWPFRGFGVPIFTPSLRLTEVFSIWAVIFTPLYYFVTGMWRKGISVATLTFISFILERYLSIEDRALESIIISEYFFIYLLLTLASFAVVLSLCKGYRVFALIVGLSMSAFVFLTHTDVAYLHLGVSTAFMWMVGGIMGTTLTLLSFFYFLGRQWCMFVICSAHLVFFSMAGVPLSFEWYYLPSGCFSILIGSQAIWDRYRHKVLGQRFWW